jgi:hypothetical protein
MLAPNIKKLVVHWQRFGPYHIARLNAAQQTMEVDNWSIVGLEIASEDNVYSWEPKALRSLGESRCSTGKNTTK